MEDNFLLIDNSSRLFAKLQNLSLVSTACSVFREVPEKNRYSFEKRQTNEMIDIKNDIWRVRIDFSDMDSIITLRKTIRR